MGNGTSTDQLKAGVFVLAFFESLRLETTGRFFCFFYFDFHSLTYLFLN